MCIMIPRPKIAAMTLFCIINSIVNVLGFASRLPCMIDARILLRFTTLAVVFPKTFNSGYSFVSPSKSLRQAVLGSFPWRLPSSINAGFGNHGLILKLSPRSTLLEKDLANGSEQRLSIEQGFQHLITRFVHLSNLSIYSQCNTVVRIIY